MVTIIGKCYWCSRCLNVGKLKVMEIKDNPDSDVRKVWACDFCSNKFASGDDEAFRKVKKCKTA